MYVGGSLKFKLTNIVCRLLTCSQWTSTNKFTLNSTKSPIEHRVNWKRICKKKVNIESQRCIQSLQGRQREKTKPGHNEDVYSVDHTFISEYDRPSMQQTSCTAFPFHFRIMLQKATSEILACIEDGEPLGLTPHWSYADSSFLYHIRFLQKLATPPKLWNSRK